MIRARMMFALAMGVASAAPAFALRPPPPEEQASAVAAEVTDADELVVLATNEAEASALRVSVVERGYAVRASNRLGGLDLVMLTLTIPPSTTPAEAIAEVETLFPGSTAGVNHRFELDDTAPPPDVGSSASPRRYADELIGWPETGCAAQTVIGLLDGDVDIDDPVLANARIERRRFVEGATDPRHGTAVASLIVGDTRLLGPTLRAATVADANGGAGVDAMVRGLDWTVSRGATVVNVALSGPYNKILDRGFEAASDRGVSIVAAVGNEGPDHPPRYPAAFADVIAVTAVGADGRVLPQAVRGDHVTLAAPGVDVWVDAGGGRYETGTSFSTAFVTAALATSADPEGFSATLVGRTLDLSDDGPDPIFGHGLLQVGESCTP